MNIPLLTYLSVSKDSNDIVQLDEERLRFIRGRYIELLGENDPDDEQIQEQTIKKLLEKLPLNTDKISMELLHICVLSSSDDSAKLGIIEKVLDSSEPFILPTLEPSTESKQRKKSKKQTIQNKVQEQDVQELDHIICIIHQKLDRPEVNEFIENFL